MADFRFPLSQLIDGKRPSTHTSVNPFVLKLITNDASPVLYDGHQEIEIDLTALTVATAGKLSNSRTIAISGAVTGTATSFDGTANITIATTALDVSKANAGTLAIGRGGTGQTSWSAYGIVYASAANTLGQLSVGTSGQVLSSKGSAAPVWLDQADIIAGEAGKLSNSRTIIVDLNSTSSASFNGTANVTVGISNNLPVTHGGTGKGSWTAYGLIYASASTTLAQIAAGTDGQILKSQGNSKAPVWEDQTNLAVGSAAQFTSAKSISLTGDVTGSASSVGGWSITTSIGNDKITNAMLAGSIENSKLTNHSITVGTQTINLGSSINLATLIKDLGMGKAFRYLGTVGAVPTSNTVNGQTCAAGDLVVVVGASNSNLDGVYAYDGSNWSKITTAGAYKVLQDVVSNPNSSGTAYQFISSIAQDANGVITATRAGLPFATAIQNIGTTASAGSANTVPRGDHVHAIDLATGDANGQVKIAGTNVSVKGLGTAAYTASTAYATSGHTHSISLTAAGTASITLVSDTTYTLTAGGESIVFKMPVSTDTKVTVDANIATNANYPVVLAYSDTDTTDAETNILNKSGAKLYFNPSSGQLTATTVANAIWNDYAEMRKTNSEVKFGQCVIDNDDGSLSIANARLLPGAQVVSDTWGHIMGETENAKTPVAVAGRVLVYPYRDINEYHAGQAVCTAPNGTVDIMSREEIMMYPDCIIGIVSEIPDYEIWGTGNVQVNGRIWIKIK